jgi:hypothetical protein
MELEKIDHIESELTKIQATSISENQNLYLMILGNQSKKAIRTLPNFVEGIELLWDGWSGPKWMKYIFFFIPGQAGLYKFSNKSKMMELAIEASNGGLIQIIMSKNEIDKSLVRLLTEKEVNPQYVRDFLKTEKENELIEIACDTHQEIDDNPAGYYIKILN